jgi:hypothetical protein
MRRASRPSRFSVGTRSNKTMSSSMVTEPYQFAFENMTRCWSFASA